MTKEKILKEFDKRFYFSDGILCETIGNSGHSCNLNDIKDFISKVISQTREETLGEIKRLLPSSSSDGDTDFADGYDTYLQEVLNILNKLKN